MRQDNQMNLSPTVLRAFATLAGPATDTDFQGNERFSRLFASAQSKQRERAEEAIEEELINVVSALQEQKQLLADTRRGHLAAAEEAGEAISTIDIAFAFGNSSGNYLPLLVLLGEVDPSNPPAGSSAAEWELLCTIPEDTSAETPSAG